MEIHCTYFDTVDFCIIILCLLNVMFEYNFTVYLLLYCVSAGYITLAFILMHCIFFRSHKLNRLSNFHCSLLLYSRYCADRR
jgi:hypothetical protein